MTGEFLLFMHRVGCMSVDLHYPDDCLARLSITGLVLGSVDHPITLFKDIKYINYFHLGLRQYIQEERFIRAAPSLASSTLSQSISLTNLDVDISFAAQGVAAKVEFDLNVLDTLPSIEIDVGYIQLFVKDANRELINFEVSGFKVKRGARLSLDVAIGITPDPIM